MYSDKQILKDMYTIVSFVIQRGQVSEGEVILMACHVYWLQFSGCQK